MNVTDRFHATERQPGRDPFVHPGPWKLWQVPRPFLVLVLSVDALAVMTITGTAMLYPVTRQHVLWFAVLAGLSIIHLEVTRHVERMRELASEGVPYISLKAIWTFAGLLILPPSLVAALIVITYMHSWYRVGRSILPHRSIFSASTVVLASMAAGAVLVAASPSGYPGVPLGWVGLGVIAAAALTRWAVNSALVFVAMPLMSPQTSWRQALRAVFGTPGDDLIEFASLSVGAVAAVVLTFNLPLVLAFGLLLMVAHRSVRFEYAAERDRETGALRLDLWQELARQQLQRVNRLGTAVGYLIVRLDRPDRLLVDVAGRRLGRLVTKAIRSVIRDSDLVGRLPYGLDFAVLVADISPDDLGEVAERIRQAVKAIKIVVDGPTGPTSLSGLTVSIGGAGYPVPAGTLSELMICADNALMLAKTYVRDEVSIVGPDTPTAVY